MGERTTFIKIDRSLLNHWIWKDGEPYSRAQAWIEILALAAVKDHKYMLNGHLVEVKRGQLPTSDRVLADRWKWSRDRVRRFLRTLESDGMVSIKRTTGGTVLTVENYAFYQDKRSTDKTTDKPPTRPQTDHRQDTPKNDKNDKNEKECVCISAPRKNTHACGAFSNVWLTDAEEAEIRETYERPQELIDKVSAWLTEHERKNHMATINTFARNDKWPKRPVISHAEPEEAREEYVPMPDEIRKKWKGAIKKI